MTLSARVAAALGVDVLAERPLAGGDLGGATRLSLASGEEVVAKSGGLVAIEARMLQAMATTAVSVPKVLHVEGDLLLMEYIHADGRAGWGSLAQALGLLHHPTDAQFGWPEDYAFGPLAIANGARRDWPSFWADRRLLPFCASVSPELALRIEGLARRLADLLPQSPPAALLHGDLWGGNILFGSGHLAALIDPACYYGHREVDLAMLQVFGRPPESFLAAAALEPGWRERLPVYQLWPMLVHLHLFGDGYRGRVEDLLSACGA